MSDPTVDCIGTQAPVCPYCGATNEAVSDWLAVSGDTTEKECRECRGLFEIELELTATYSTARLEEASDETH